jgi:hypothetical protein
MRGVIHHAILQTHHLSHAFPPPDLSAEAIGFGTMFEVSR